MPAEPVPTPSQVEAAIREKAPDLHPETLALLVKMYSADALPGEDGTMTPLAKVKVSIEQGAMMNRLLRLSKARRSMEIGFAFGFSTIWMLDAIAANGGHHTAVDPFERTKIWNGVGLRNVEALSIAKGRFEWREDYAIHMLSDAIREKKRFGFIFIDGNHRFDDALVDFYMADQVLRQGGLVAFDDMWMPAVRTAVDFVASNRSYKRVEQPVFNMAVFQKTAFDSRPWDHFIPFEVHEGAVNPP